MGQQLAITQSLYVSVPRPDAESMGILRTILSGAFKEAGHLYVGRVPTHSEREVLRNRRDYLVTSLHHDPDKIGLLVTLMLQGYLERARATEDQARLARDVVLFQRELALDPKVPTWAVALVCNDVRLGQAEGISLIHKPTTMAFRALCDKKIWDTRAEIGQIGQALNALPWRRVSAEDDARVKSGLAMLSEALGVRIRAEAERTKYEPIPVGQMIEMAGGQENWDKIANGPPPPKTGKASASELWRRVKKMAFG